MERDEDEMEKRSDVAGPATHPAEAGPTTTTMKLSRITSDGERAMSGKGQTR